MRKKEIGLENFDRELKPGPIIKKLEEALKQDQVIELEGYVGSSVEGTLRLYKNLDLEHYVEVSKENIIASIEISNDDLGYVKVFIPASAKVRFLTQSYARASAPKLTPCTRSKSLHSMSLSYLCNLASQLIQEGKLDNDPELLAAVQDFYNNYCK